MIELKVGQIFLNYKELSEFISIYENEHATQLYKRSSKKCDDVDLLYQYITYSCKAGGRTVKPKINKIRNSRTFQRNCNFSFSVKVDPCRKLLVISKLNPVHTCPFAGHPEIYKRLPRQRRPNQVEKKVILDVKECQGNNKALIAKMSAQFGKSITGKDIQNLVRKNNGDSGQTDIEKLISTMKSFEQATVHVTYTGDLVETIFFQDHQMKQLYIEYPEVLFVDSTYRINQNRMAVMVFMVVDGNGASGVVGLALLKSESEVCTYAALESMKVSCGNMEQTKVIMADKDMGVRNAFSKSFPDASIQICIFHVLQTFLREVTCNKRNLTLNQLSEAQKILKKMVYADSEESYNQLYDSLKQIGSKELVNYFDKNWHKIREQWTMYGQLSAFTMLNRTNNRIERFNRELHDVTNKYGEITDSFKNIMKVIYAARSEREQEGIDMICKVPNEQMDVVSQKYFYLLTNFAFKKVMSQIIHSKKIINKITLNECSTGTYQIGSRSISVTLETCSCFFYSVMRLPCQHIFALAEILKKEPYFPELCSQRWLLSKYLIFNQNLHVVSNESRPVFTQPLPSIASESESQKFREMKDVLLPFAEKIAKFPTSTYKEILDASNKFISSTIDKFTVNDVTIAADPNLNQKCICLLDGLENSDSFMCCGCRNIFHMVCYGILNSYAAKFDSRSDPDAIFACINCPEQQYSDSELRKMSSSERQKRALFRIALKELITNRKIIEHPLVTAFQIELKNNNWHQHIDKTFIEFQLKQDLSEIYFANSSPSEEMNPAIFLGIESQKVTPQKKMTTIIEKIPDDHSYPSTSKGLPFKLPTIPVNIKRKGLARKSNPKTELKIYNALSTEQKKKRMLTWLIGPDMINPVLSGELHISKADLENTPKVVFQKFWNQEVNRSLIEQYLDDGAKEYFETHMNARKTWLCFQCQKSCPSQAVLCDSCMNWFHVRCAGLKKIPTKRFYVCADCA